MRRTERHRVTPPRPRYFPASAQAWLTDERPLCPHCMEPASDIATHPNPFVVEGIDEAPPTITCCERCYRERCREV